MNNMYKSTFILLLAALLTGGNAQATVTVKGNVFGGGNLADVGGNVAVNIQSGTIENDVYGGGALANTNINNATNYGDENETISNTSTNKTTVSMTGGIVKGDIYGGGLGNADTAALVYGDVAVTIQGTTMDFRNTNRGRVFGGNNINGSPLGAITVTINSATKAPSATWAISSVYGGGNLAAYTPNVTTTPATVIVNNCSNTIQDLFGGGNAASVPATDVTIHGGTFDRIFAGGNGVQDSANVKGNTSALIKGGTIRQIFGGSNIKGTIGGTINVEINKEDDGCLMQITEVYGGGNEAASNAGNLTIVRTGGDNEYIAYVYGGANDADVYGDITLNITGGRITEALFGGNNQGHTVTGDITLNINWDNANGENDKKYLKDVYGGGNEADVTGSTSISLLNGTVSNDIYGGGSQADVTGNTSISLENGTVSHDVYGGGMQGNVGGNVTVNVSKANNTGTVTVGHDVYGGGALAYTNTGNLKEGGVIKTDSLVTTVNLYPGATIGHDVYGGGLGRKAGNGQSVEALVYGNVDVNQYGAILNAVYEQGLATSGRIFGCNNVNGTPMGHVKVHVVKTTGKAGQLRSSEPDRMNADATHTYELAAVYGGGNQAEYIPYDSIDFSEVFIDPVECEDVSIHSVYGGGNAAATPATKVTIAGAYEIEYVFGGGNGAGPGNLGANVGYHYYSTPQNDIAARANQAYGTGTATTAIYGGRIHHIYGGSNTLGNVRETAVSMPDELGECPLVVDGIYGGGREAYMEGSIKLEMGCVTSLAEIYGGSEKADVDNSVELTITSGHFGKVFGGNNKGGRIFGSITVNIEQTGCVPITIDTLYLGGNNAPYSVYGYNSTTTTVDVGGGEMVTHYGLNEDSQDPPYPDPRLNIRSFESIGTIYGGGNGELAVMVANPIVDINVTKGWVNGEYVGTDSKYTAYKATAAELPTDGIITNDVFGGGNKAEVKGKTRILIGDKLGDTITLKSMEQLYNQIGVSGERRGDVQMQQVTTLDDVDSIKYTILKKEDGEWITDQTKPTLTAPIKPVVTGVTINGNVYGGGNQADVTMGTDVQIGKNPAAESSTQEQTTQSGNDTQNSNETTPTPVPTQNQNQNPVQNQNTSIESGFTRTVTPVQR